MVEWQRLVRRGVAKMAERGVLTGQDAEGHDSPKGPETSDSTNGIGDIGGYSPWGGSTVGLVASFERCATMFSLAS